jgi:hypothetical protein
MAKVNGGKKGKDSKVASHLKALLGGEENPYIIKKASIKDELCDYTYEVTDGIGIGDTHNVKGKGLIDPDLRNAFARLNVHLAVIDEVFKHSNIEIDDIDKFHTSELAALFEVTSFEIKGSKENESIILKGNKHVSSAGGRIEMDAPKIMLDNLSSYKWHNELKTEADNVRREVELYMKGKCTPVEVEEEDNSKQLSIGDQIREESNDDLESAKVS